MNDAEASSESSVTALKETSDLLPKVREFLRPKRQINIDSRALLIPPRHKAAVGCVTSQSLMDAVEVF